jgi:hypothetical protein
VPALEFIVEAGETALVMDTARAAAGDALDRITVAPIDGTPRFKVIIAVRAPAVPAVMRAVMDALEGKENRANAPQV